MVSPEFLDTLNYALCDAIHSVLGDKAVEVFRLAGRRLYVELKEKGVVSPSSRPLDILQSIARYLEASGYVNRIVLQRVNDEEVIVEMFGVSVLRSSDRLVREKKQPSHIMTNTMFAALAELGYSAHITDLLLDVEGNHVVEKWSLKSAT